MIYNGNDCWYFKYTHEDKSFCNPEMTLNQETESSNKLETYVREKHIIIDLHDIEFSRRKLESNINKSIFQQALFGTIRRSNICTSCRKYYWKRV